MSGRRPTRMTPALTLLGLLAGDLLARDVDLVKSTSPAREDAGTWQGKMLSEVLAVDDIASIVLLKAVTNAPPSLDLSNLRRMLSDAATAPLQTPDSRGFLQLGTTNSTWEAVLLMRSGQVFGLVVGPPAAELPLLAHRGCLVADGERACFDIPPPAGAAESMQRGTTDPKPE